MAHRFLLLGVFSGQAALLAGCLIDGGPFPGGLGGEAGSFTSEGGAAQGGSGASTSTGGSGGGTTSSTTSSTSTSTTSSVTGECTKDADCPDPPSPCLGPRCANGTCTGKPVNVGMECDEGAPVCHEFRCDSAGECASVPVPEGTVLTDGQDGDCRQPVCGEDGAVLLVPDDSDLPGSTECMGFDCEEGDVVEQPKTDGTACFFFDLGECCDGKCCGFECTVCE